MRGKLALLPLLLASLTLARAQEPQGKIVFFRTRRFSDNNFSPPIFCDGVLLGRMVGGTYLEVSAPFGTHQCVAESVEGTVATVDVEADGPVYFRVDIKGDMRHRAILERVPDGEYFSLKSKLQPLSAGAQLGAAPGTATTEPKQDVVSATDVADSDEVAERDSERAHKGEVTYPACEYCPSPVYTPTMRKTKVEGTVTLRVLVHANGHGTVIKVLRTSGYKDMDDSAAATISEWRFKPSHDSTGVAVDFMTLIQVTFHLFH